MVVLVRVVVWGVAVVSIWAGTWLCVVVVAVVVVEEALPAVAVKLRTGYLDIWLTSVGKMLSNGGISLVLVVGLEVV